jgi:uncharacterized protein
VNEAGKKVRVAAVADLHTHKTSQGLYREMFAEISSAADTLLLCGDLTNLGTAEEAEVLAADLHACRIPVLAVLGNHDHQHGTPGEVRKVLQSLVTFLDEETFELDGLGFAGVKGFAGGFNQQMLTAFGEEPIKQFVSEAVSECLCLEKQLQALDTGRMVVALHYAPIPETVQGEPPEIFPFLGCSRLAETIDRFPVAAVFHGHAHIGSWEGKTSKGIPVYNCCHALLKRRNQQQPYALMEL